ncbi:hypothetical protein HG537_0F03140 [Torulaspora globosa]|uniref:HMA domain-containing protein n=1 Tax=Torulaspora globosa TaxID=48254 RepID=A0A7H9HW63_9SACH|nr:hypothetical protein HG537_0F03140 [Torulaspora sp. CBS 2947]
MRQAVFHVGGMSCSACVNTITSQMMSMKGVLDCKVSLMTNECFVEYDGLECSLDELKTTIEDCGFDCEVVRESEVPNGGLLKQGLLTVSGMTCGACVATVTKQVEALEGVERAVTALLTEECRVDFDESKVSMEEIKETIEECGFEASIVSVTDPESQSNCKNIVFKVFPVSADADPALDAERFNSLVGDGILSAERDGDSVLAIRYDRNELGIRQVVDRISALGYEAVIASTLDNNAQIRLLSKVQEIHFWTSACLRACFFAITTMVLYMGLPMLIPSVVKSNRFPYNATPVRGLYYRDLIGLVAATYVQFFVGHFFYRAFWTSLKHKSGTMDTLVCISTSCAYFFSLYSIIHNIVHPRANGKLPNVIFDTSVMLIAFITLGKLLETKAKSATSTALSKLISLTPSSCTILQNGDSENPLDIPIDLLEVGDTVEVKPGMRIPADGVVLRGETEVDESLMTGESLLVHKKEGSLVIGGSVNGPGHFYFKATGVGDESKLSAIIRTMKQAQLIKAPIQRYADFVASVFVPSILALALITFFVWIILSKAFNIGNMQNSENGVFYECLQRAISVVIVACPCALGLAAPTAIMVGTGVGAQNQVLIKGGEVLEKFNNVGAFIFDKTGTLTTGQMKVERFLPDGSFENGDDLIACIRASEAISEHPVARAIVQYCDEQLLGKSVTAKALNGEIHMGQGLSCECELNGATYKLRIGSKSLMPSGFQSSSKSATENRHGFTLCYVSVNDVVVAKFELVDDIKKDASNTIEYLTQRGFSTYLVTGDNANSALKVAHQVGIDMNNIFSEVPPNGKSDVVRQLREELNQGVVFVGDGINDSPALVTSDIGISISTGTDIAMEAADVVVLCDTDARKASLKGLVDALDISQKTFRRVKLNLFWALCYNTFMIPIAMGILTPWQISLHPMAAGLAMALSSVSVVLSSLALKRWKPVDFNTTYNNRSHKLSSSWLSRFKRRNNTQTTEDIELQTDLLQHQN